MTEQTLVKCGCSQPVYKLTRCGLKVAPPFRSLKTVFLTDNQYIPRLLINDDEVPTKVATSTYDTVAAIDPTCQYLRWEQLTPPGRASFGLSWLIIGNVPETSDPREVIQFLTAQLSYTIKWKITRTGSGTSRIVFVPVGAGDRQAFEAPDICGDRIIFNVGSAVGDVTEGSFTVPGQYGQFVISAPDHNVSMQLSITGFLDPPYIYGPGIFTTETKCGKVTSYTNVELVGSDLGVGVIQRVTEPTFRSLEALTIGQYSAVVYLPCFPSSTEAQPSQTRCFPSALQMVAPQSGCFASSTEGPQTVTPQLVPSQPVGPLYTISGTSSDYGITSSHGDFFNLSLGRGTNVTPKVNISPVVDNGTVQMAGSDVRQFILRGATTYMFVLNVGNPHPEFETSSVWTLSPNSTEFQDLGGSNPFHFTFQPAYDTMTFQVINTATGLAAPLDPGSIFPPGAVSKDVFSIDLAKGPAVGPFHNIRSLERLPGLAGGQFVLFVRVGGRITDYIPYSVQVTNAVWSLDRQGPVIGGFNPVSISFTVQEVQ